MNILLERKRIDDLSIKRQYHIVNKETGEYMFEDLNLDEIKKQFPDIYHQYVYKRKLMTTDKENYKTYMREYMRNRLK